ncbi:MAG: hypothetical protein WAK82_09385 [Streptosporangiaceae bacterium]
MSGILLRQVRIEQSCRRLDRLRATADEWIEQRHKEDVTGQYATQLDVLRTAVIGPLGELREIITGALSASGDTGRVYAACRTSDTRAELVRRVFTYYQGKLDQRHDKTFGPVLRAADDVVWSCWAEPFRSAIYREPDITMPPVPLPYIESQYSPAAVPRDDPPADLAAEQDDSVLIRYLERLPIPLIALPAVCADEPWWLAYAGHEVGHHLQHDLVDGWRLVKAFGGLTEAAARAGGEADPARWRTWSAEIFADICSVYAMGPAAVYGIVELELDDADKMLRGKAKYPPPLVRLGIMATVAGRLGLEVSAALEPAGLDLAGLPQVATIAALTEAALADPLCGRGPFRQLLGWDPAAFAPGGTIDSLRDGLRDLIPLRIRPGIRTARLLTSAAVAAWEEIASMPDPRQREDSRCGLAGRFLPAVLDGREDGTRAAADQARPDTAALSDDLTRLLIESIPEET